MKRLFELILLILIALIAFSCPGCHTEKASDTEKVTDTALTAGWFTIPNDVVYWVETENKFDPNHPNRVIEHRFYTNNLARAQDRVPFPIVLPGYFPDKAKRIVGPCIEGPLIAGSDNETEVIVRYDVYLSEAWSQIFIKETDRQYWHPETQPYLHTSLVEIGGKQVSKTEVDHPLGPGTLWGFSSDSTYFFVELYNFPADEAMKIVESIIEPTVGYAPKTETEAVPETGETGTVPGTEIVLEPDILSAALSPESAIADTIAIIESRLNSLGIKGANVKKQDGGLIVVQLPKIGDIDLVVALVTSRGELDFRERVLDAYSRPVLDGEGNQQWVIAKAVGSDGQEKELTGEYLKPNAEVVLSPQTNKPEVAFEWNSEGAILFEQITLRNLKQPLGIFLDDKLISAPTVQSVIKDKGVITGISLDEAKTLAIQLNSGALPVQLHVVSIEAMEKN